MSKKVKGASKSNKDEPSVSSKSSKVCNSVKARHILCTKHSKAIEALELLNNGARFDEVSYKYTDRISILIYT